MFLTKRKPHSFFVTHLKRCLFICSSPLPASDAVEPGEEAEEDATLPCTEDVICKTEQITKNIQELLRAAQETKHER